MISRLVHLLTGQDETSKERRHDRVQLAVAVLLLEMAHADRTFAPLEKKLVNGLLRERFGLDAGQADELIAAAEKKRDESFDLHQFTRLINEHFTLEEKLEVMEGLWRLVYADGELDRYEDALARQLAGLLRLSHRQAISMKLRVLDEVDPERRRR
ncbi:putative tellurite resistance protein B-like protein [Geothermobacter ehrlichii]|uniref:Putative tellurite resistance protein B-like protein n=1 Tax=Geothermobacter ehrlichii TaxID=213224 RepID=A0A5D3WHD7_9BACT|nr:TerB family tellurite resistance protein [Geothermobacter ehrlichii]TYO98269.1 putative tellurite resistance protein B-like protein [Geothermobacter ehrlichii]